MKLFVIVNTITSVASLAITPPLTPEKAHVDVRMDGTPPTVDQTATRGQWVSSYSYQGFEWEHPEHWLPAGPRYLDLDTLNKGYHAPLMAVHDADSWIQSSILSFKRYFNL
ncbi:hypothetical protein F4803DRAFT_531544 [Xylaria telfairii]|nr:hypothetical protein F4803DRAFT_531544 [Xylaria telfairii]